MSRQQTDDELFEIKNYFYIGNFQQCINEAQKLRKPSTPEIAIQRDIFAYRSYIAQNKFLVVLDEIKQSSPEEIQHIKLLAEYFGSKQKREAVVAQLDQKVAAHVDDTLAIVAANIYMHEKKYEQAYRVLHSVDGLEAMALTIDILLKIHRIDLAKKKLEEMQEKDDDATLTQLAQAWIFIVMGNAKLEDAYYIYHELIDKYGATTALLNGQALACLGQQKYVEAEAALQEALDKDPNNAETILNYIALSRRSGKHENAKRYMAQLRDAYPDHEYIRDLKQKENDFQRIKQMYAPTHASVPA